MIIETGRILAIEPEGLWVETLQRSTCGSCKAQKACGQRVLAEMGANASRLWVLLDGRDIANYRPGDEVKIGVPENVIAKGALLIYLVPLVTMIAAVIWAHGKAMGDGPTAACALVGLLLGAAIVRVRSWQIRLDTRLQPVLVDERAAVRVLQSCEAD